MIFRHSHKEGPKVYPAGESGCVLSGLAVISGLTRKTYLT